MEFEICLPEFSQRLIHPECLFHYYFIIRLQRFAVFRQGFQVKFHELVGNFIEAHAGEDHRTEVWLIVAVIDAGCHQGVEKFCCFEFFPKEAEHKIGIFGQLYEGVPVVKFHKKQD